MTPPTPAATIVERDAGRYIGLTPAFLRKARREGRGPAYLRIGRTIRYRIVDLDDWLLKHRVETRESRRAS